MRKHFRGGVSFADGGVLAGIIDIFLQKQRNTKPLSRLRDSSPKTLSRVRGALIEFKKC